MQKHLLASNSKQMLQNVVKFAMSEDEERKGNSMRKENNNNN